ncbi:MAG: hypothetical protein EZS28_002287, partial [Streblomastix strix]
MTMTTDTAPSGLGQISKKELKMIAMAHGTCNKRQAKLSSNNKEIKAITQGLRSFAKVQKSSRIQSLATRIDNRVKNKIADALSRLSRAGDYKLKEKIFRQTSVLKKIREEQIDAMITAPLQPGQIWYTELVNENAQSVMLDWSNEILERGTSLT